MLTRHLDFDAFSGMETLFHYDELTDQTVIETRQDVSAALDACKELSNLRAQQGGRVQSWEMYAHIPDIVQLKWFAEKGVKAWDKSHEKEVWKLLNDPEYSRLKVANFYHRPKG